MFNKYIFDMLQLLLLCNVRHRHRIIHEQQQQQQFTSDEYYSPLPKEIINIILQYVQSFMTKLIVIGGIVNEHSIDNTAEMHYYDWQLQIWMKINMRYPFGVRDASATQLRGDNGCLLVGGGWYFNKYVNSYVTPACFIINNLGVVVTVGNLNIIRNNHAFVTVGNKHCICFGGDTKDNKTLDSIEIFNTHTLTWTLANSKMHVPRSALTAVVLEDNNVLICGGGAGGHRHFSSCEIFNVKDTTFYEVADMKTARSSHAAVLLPNGDVLVTGGYNYNKDTCLAEQFASCEIYTPSTNEWIEGPSLLQHRLGHGCAVLPDNTVIVFGGWDGKKLLSSCEMLDLANMSNKSWSWSYGVPMLNASSAFAYSLIEDVVIEKRNNSRL